MERAEHLVVLNVKRAGGLEVALVCDEGRGLDVEFLGGADLAELLVVLLSRDPGRPPRSATVVVVGMGVEVLGVVLLGTVVEELRHDYRAVERRWFRWLLGEGRRRSVIQGARPQQSETKGAKLGREDRRGGGELQRSSVEVQEGRVLTMGIAMRG
jgi:hypothetical protein